MPKAHEPLETEQDYGIDSRVGIYTYRQTYVGRIQLAPNWLTLFSTTVIHCR
jgi:hypothetical protein